jgi:hypothetical protein
MAEINVQAGTKFTIASTGLYILGDASDADVSTYVVHLVDGGSFSGSLAPSARSRAPQAQTGVMALAPTGGGADLDDIAFVAVAYQDQATGAYATTAITALPALFSMRASGLVCALDVTDLSAGSIIAYVQRVLGPNA